MIPITGYKQSSFTDFVKALNNAFENSQKNIVQIAAEIKVKSAVTVKNSLRYDNQVVSDEVLTKVMKSISMAGLVIWVFGKKYYYVKENN